MSAISRVLTAVLMIALGAGQVFAQKGIAANCGRPSLSLAVGLATNGDRNGGGDTSREKPRAFARDLAASFELPVHDEWSARFDVGTVAWTFQAHDPSGMPRLRDRVHLTRATLSAVRTAPDTCPSPLRLYTGGGIGVYRYRSDNGEVDRTRLGIHGVAGVDLMVSDRTAIRADVGMHAVRGPDASPVFSYILWALRANVGVRIRF